MPFGPAEHEAILAARQTKKAIAVAQTDSIRQLFFEKGLGYAEIVRTTGFDVKTVKKYVHMENFNQPLPKPRQIRGSKLDKQREQIDEWMVADKQERKKQRHTAKRTFDRIAEKHPGFDYSYRLVADYVSQKKKVRIPMKSVHSFWIKESSDSGEPRLTKSERSDAWRKVMSLG